MPNLTKQQPHNKENELDKLKIEMSKDKSLPLLKNATRLVFGVGNPESKFIFIGEGPGYWEDQKGEPFVGNAGKLLDRLLQSIKLDRSKIYITNVVHHRPPENRDPTPEEIAAYAPYLDRIIEIINPKLIITLGRFSMAKFLAGVKITAVHGNNFDIKLNGKDIIVIPMYHPAAALRSSQVMELMKNDFLNLSETISRIKNEPAGKQLNLI